MATTTRREPERSFTSNRMAETNEAVKEAIEMHAESVENVQAADVEQQRGAPSVSVDILIAAVRKEREGLDKLETGIDVLRDSLEERRHALDRQQEILEQLVVQLKETEAVL